jgi:uncharacterized protein
VNTETGFADSPPAGRPGVAARLLLLGVSAYRILLSPLLGGFCRFEPSCSRYAEQALRRHGAARGTLLTVKRLFRCQPFHQGGLDPVP